jgi:hypothetical protein
MGLWTMLLALFGFCPHESRYREQRDGVLHFVCDRCGHGVPAIERTKAERKKMSRTFAPPTPTKAQRQDGPVVQITTRKRRAK